MPENPHGHWISGMPLTVRTAKASIVNERV